MKWLYKINLADLWHNTPTKENINMMIESIRLQINGLPDQDVSIKHKTENILDKIDMLSNHIKMEEFSLKSSIAMFYTIMDDLENWGNIKIGFNRLCWISTNS